MRKILAAVFTVLFVNIASLGFAINVDKLSDADIVRVQNLLEKLQPLIKEREALQSLATLTFEELYAQLDEEYKNFLAEFHNLKGEELGVKIPYRGLATGKEELVVLRDQNIKLKGQDYTIPPQYLPPDVFEKYSQMMDAMQKDLGRRLYVESGYRSSAYQLYLFIYYMKNHDYSIQETRRFVALPGYSEHGAPKFQAIDFINQDGINGEEIPEEFETLEEYKWLQENAAKFDFYLSYPRGHEGITFEPWHWRHEAPKQREGL